MCEQTEQTQKKAVVSGGCLALVGGIAGQLAQAGYRVAVIGLADEAQAAAELGGAYWYRQADLAQPLTPEQAVKDAAEALGGVDLLVCTVGVFPAGGLLNTTLEEMDNAHNLNYRSFLLQAKAAANLMIEAQKPGSIVFVTSNHGLRAYKDDFLYGSLQAALHRACESLAMQLAPYRVRINCVAHGELEGVTPVPQEEPDFAFRLPLQRRETMQELGDAILYLGEKAGYSTGTVLKTDGGLTLAGMPEAPYGYGWDKDRDLGSEEDPPWRKKD